MKVKIKEILNEILNCKLFVLLMGIIIFIKTIYFYKNTIAIFDVLEIQTIIGTISFLAILMCFLSIAQWDMIMCRKEKKS